MAWWGGAAEPEKPVEPVKPEPQEDLGMMGNAWRSTCNGVSTGATATKDGFVYVAAGGAEYIGDGYTWCEDTACWMWTGTSTWVADTFSCGGATPKN